MAEERLAEERLAEGRLAEGRLAEGPSGEYDIALVWFAEPIAQWQASMNLGAPEGSSMASHAPVVMLAP